MLSYMQMITELSINRNPEISKFFIEEKRFGKERGPMTYVPIQVILDFLKKETIDQRQDLKDVLRRLLIDQLRIKNEKVWRFILLESEFSINVLSKYLFYISILPEEIELIRHNFSDFPDASKGMIYKNCLNLKTQLESTAAKSIAKSYVDFVSYSRFINELAMVAVSSGVEYQSDYQGETKKLIFIEQITYFFFTTILIDYLQPLILQESKRQELPSHGGGMAFDYLKTSRTAL